MTRAVVFDANETMLDLAALDPLFQEWFGDAGTRREWFAWTIHFALTLAATRTYRSFGEVGAAALEALARGKGVVLPEDAGALVRQAMLQLPPHPDVKPALILLRDAGLVTAALSNNPLPTLHAQLRHADLDSLFDEIMSVDEVGALKPSPAVYRFTADRLGMAPSEIWMVAAHGWDVAGAMRAGLRGAFLARPGQWPDPFAPPEVIAGDLALLARQIIEHMRVS